MRRRAVFTAVLMALVSLSGEAYSQYAQTNPVERGAALVLQNCSACHAVGPEGASPHPQAPPFRKLSERFPIDALEETFIGSIDTGHPGMPVFLADQDQIDAIIAYIATVME